MNDKQQRLIDTFGLTRLTNKAGFILPDGTMLDLSNADRAHRIYHAEALNVLYGLPPKGSEWTDLDLVLMIGELSMIRFCASGHIHVANKPTPEQLRQLYKLISYRSNPFEVLLSHSCGVSMARHTIVSPTMKMLQDLFSDYDKVPLPICFDEFLLDEADQQLQFIFRPLQKSIASYHFADKNFSIDPNYECVMPLFKEMVSHNLERKKVKIA